ncbi:MAG: HEAT repeat domain-containing protein [Planctomycetes bacterium]|nr:HEAT repeat domain-containing protein [Planctomycetota bacterium]
MSTNIRRPIGVCAVIGFIMLIVSSFSCTQEGTATTKEGVAAPKDSDKEFLEKYMPSDGQKRCAIYEQLSDDRKHTIYQMIWVIEKLKAIELEQMEGSRLDCCISILGEFHAEEAVDELLSIIEVRTWKMWGGLEAPKDPTVIRALAKIGKPVSLKAVAMLAQDDSAVKAPMYVRVIALVEGVDLGKEMVRLAAEKEKDATKKARLEKAMELFKNADKVIN